MCVISINRRNRRSSQGQGLAELCGGLVVMVPILLACIDLGTIALGASINDNICQNAAFAAAAGPPSTRTVSTADRTVGSSQDPYLRALSVVRSQSPRNLPIKVGENIQVSESIRNLPPNEVGGSFEGDVNVSTTVTVMPPFLVSAVVGAKGIELRSKHIAPFTYALPQLN